MFGCVGTATHTVRYRNPDENGPGEVCKDHAGHFAMLASVYGTRHVVEKLAR
jgi:hypothetical protein